MARLSFFTPASRRALERRTSYRLRVWRTRARRSVRPLLRLVPDPTDRQLLALWTVRALALLAAASTCGLAVRLFGVTSGLF